MESDEDSSEDDELAIPTAMATEAIFDEISGDEDRAILAPSPLTKPTLPPSLLTSPSSMTRSKASTAANAASTPSSSTSTSTPTAKKKVTIKDKNKTTSAKKAAPALKKTSTKKSKSPAKTTKSPKTPLKQASPSPVANTKTTTVTPATASISDVPVTNSVFHHLHTVKLEQAKDRAVAIKNDNPQGEDAGTSTNPDTSLYTAPMDSDEEDEETQWQDEEDAAKATRSSSPTHLVPDDATTQEQVPEENITATYTSDATSVDSPIKPTKLHKGTAADAEMQETGDDVNMPDAATTTLSVGVPQTKKKKAFIKTDWFLMWNEIPSSITEVSSPKGSSTDWIQLWVPMILDYLYDNGLQIQLLSHDEENNKPFKRKTETYVEMLAREVCSWEDFQDYFLVQPYFTTPPHRVHIQTCLYYHGKLTMAKHITLMENLRSTMGTSWGRDPGEEAMPANKGPPGSLHTDPPKEREAYFLSCCGVKIIRTNLLRFTWRTKNEDLPSMVVDAAAGGPSPEQLLQRHMGKALDRLQDITESDLAVIQFKSTYKIPPITLKKGTFSDQLQKMSVGTFRRYFNRGSVPKPKKWFWADVLLAFNGDSRNFNRDSYEDLEREFGVALYSKGIQTSTHTDRPYWLLYSHPTIDYSFLEDELKYRTGVDIELRFKIVNDGTPQPAYVEGVQRVVNEHDANALLLGCGAEQLQHITLSLPALFNTKGASTSFATHLRLVTIHGSAITEKEREYQINSRTRQSAYVRHARTFVINTIIDLDKEIMGDHGPISLRHFILSLTRPSDPKNKELLFCEVGPKLRAPGKVVLVVRPDAYSEAESIVTGLLPMAVHYHGQNMIAAFHPTARIAMALLTWDPIRRIVISPDDHVYDDLAQGDDWMAFENLDDVAVPAQGGESQRIADATPAPLPPTAGEHAAGRAMFGDDDAATLGSLREAQANQAPASKQRKKKKETTQMDLDQARDHLRFLFSQNDMDFDSDDESIRTSLSIRDQMRGMKALMKQVQHTQASMEDLKLRGGEKQTSGEQSKSSSSNGTDGTNGVTNLTQAELGSATQAPPC